MIICKYNTYNIMYVNTYGGGFSSLHICDHYNTTLRVLTSKHNIDSFFFVGVDVFKPTIGGMSYVQNIQLGSLKNQ